MRSNGALLIYCISVVYVELQFIVGVTVGPMVGATVCKDYSKRWGGHNS